jgi:hypothetical protein
MSFIQKSSQLKFPSELEINQNFLITSGKHFSVFSLLKELFDVWNYLSEVPMYTFPHRKKCKQRSLSARE